MSTIETIPPSRAGLIKPARSWFGKLFKPILQRRLTRRELSRTRLRLFELSDAELRDIGLTREVAAREACRSLLACYLNNSR